MPESSANILLVDGDDLFRSELRTIIESFSTAKYSVYEASSGEDCISIVHDHAITIVFMGFSLPGIDGVSTSLRLLQIDEDLKIILLAGREARAVSRVVLQAGISGHMARASVIEEIDQAIDCVLQGGTYLSREIANQVALDSLKPDKNTHQLSILSRRELQVALLLMDGHKPASVGAMLFLSPKSVSTYKRRAFEKLKVDSLVDLVQIGRDCGFIGGQQQHD